MELDNQQKTIRSTWRAMARLNSKDTPEMDAFLHKIKSDPFKIFRQLSGDINDPKTEGKRLSISFLIGCCLGFMTNAELSELESMNDKLKLSA